MNVRKVAIGALVALVVVVVALNAAGASNIRAIRRERYSVADGIMGLPTHIVFDENPLAGATPCKKQKAGLRIVRGSLNRCDEHGRHCVPIQKQSPPMPAPCDTAPHNDGWFTERADGAACSPVSAYHRSMFNELAPNAFSTRGVPAARDRFESLSWDVRDNFSEAIARRFTPNPHSAAMGAPADGTSAAAIRLLGVPTRITDEL